MTEGPQGGFQLLIKSIPDAATSLEVGVLQLLLYASRWDTLLRFLLSFAGTFVCSCSSYSVYRKTDQCLAKVQSEPHLPSGVVLGI